MIHYGFVFLIVTNACRSEMTGKVVGGKQAHIENWPFIAFLMHYREEKMYAACGSSLISSQTVLTAAHCLADVLKLYGTMAQMHMSILMGHHNIFKSTMIREVVDFTCHNKYSVDGTNHDIGVVFLDRPVTFSRTVMKGLLQSKPVDYNRQTHLLIAGWGATANDNINEPSEKLQYITQRLLPRKECVKRIPGIENKVICVIDTDNKFANRGDSGGPLVTQDKIQIGIVSYAMEGDVKITVYTSVPEYFDWIKETQFELYFKNCRSKIQQKPIKNK